MTGVFPGVSKEGELQTQGQSGHRKEGLWQRQQRWEGCGRKPNNTNDTQPPQKLGSGQETFLPRAFQSRMAP